MNRRKLFGMLAAVPLIPAIALADEPSNNGIIASFGSIPFKRGPHGKTPIDLVAFLMSDARSVVKPGQKVEIRITKGDTIGWYWDKGIQSSPIISTRYVQDGSLDPYWTGNPWVTRGYYVVSCFRA